MKSLKISSKKDPKMKSYVDKFKEIIKNDPKINSYDEKFKEMLKNLKINSYDEKFKEIIKNDLFSLGVLIYKLIFLNRSRKELNENNFNNNYSNINTRNASFLFDSLVRII